MADTQFSCKQRPFKKLLKQNRSAMQFIWGFNDMKSFE